MRATTLTHAEPRDRHSRAQLPRITLASTGIVRSSLGVALAGCLLLGGPTAQEPASRPAAEPRSSATSPDRQVFFAAWALESVDRRPLEALAHYRKLWEDPTFSDSDLRTLAAIRTAEIARDRGDEPLLRRAITFAARNSPPPGRWRVLEQTLKNSPVWRDYVGLVARLRDAVDDGRTQPDAPAASGRVQAAREELLAHIGKHDSFFAGPLFTFGNQAMAPDVRGDDPMASRERIRRRIDELVRAGRENDPETRRLRSQLNEPPPAARPPARRLESSRIVQRRILGYEFEILEAHLRGDHQRASLLESEVENLRRGTGPLPPSREQKVEFLKRFFEWWQKPAGAEGPRGGDIPDATRRSFQRRLREINAMRDENRVEDAFEALRALRKATPGAGGGR